MKSIGLRLVELYDIIVFMIMLFYINITHNKNALTLLVGRQEWHYLKKLGFLMLTIWSFARLIAPVVTTTSVILSSNKIQNGDVLVPANPDPSGKWLLKWREKCISLFYEIQ